MPISNEEYDEDDKIEIKIIANNNRFKEFTIKYHQVCMLLDEFNNTRITVEHIN